MKKVTILLLIAILVLAFFSFDFHQWLTLESLKSSQEIFAAWEVSHPWLVPFLFFIIYIAVTALSLPGAAILTLAAGALFGLSWGTLLVSFASSIGATLAFTVSRYILRDSVQKRFGARLETINQGVKKEGAFYLFTLRLVPVFPFVLINLLMGLTSIRTVTFYWVSQLGMLAGTIVYINAGTQLAQLESLGDVLSPALLFSFVLLGCFPLLAKKLIELVKKRRVYAHWQRPKSFDRNLIVIGAGAGGLVSAYIAATVKAKVTLIEAGKMGGDCLNYGCVPSKALIKSASVAHKIRNASKYGLEDQTALFSFGSVMQRIHKVISAIEPHDSVERYTNLGVEVVKGYARLIDPWTVEIQLNEGGVYRLSARSIILATGAKPFVPPLPGMDECGYVTSDTVWEKFAEREDAPKKLIVLGGGPIGCELAQSFSRLGSTVTQIEMEDRVLVKEDKEVSALATKVLQRDGVKLLTGHRALSCELEQTERGERKFLVVDANGEQTRIEFDELLCAVGRVARLDGYGLKELGIDSRRSIAANEYLETLYPNIYAAGDVVGPYQFTHVASHQAWYATVNALFGKYKKFKVDYRVIPRVTFIDPEVAQVGLNEQEAMTKAIAYEVTRYNLDDLDRAITESATQGFVKVLTQPGKDKIIGVVIVGEHAGELLAEFVLAMKHGLGLNKILGTIHSYPTWSEANKFAAGKWKRAHAPEAILTWLEKLHRWHRG